MESERLASAPVESSTTRFTVYTPGAVAIPEIVPVDGSMLSPVGSPVADQVYGGKPPDAKTVSLYWAPTVASGSEPVVMASGATLVPASVTVWGLSGALSVRIREPDAAPALWGEKVTWMLHWAPGATVVVHPLAVKGPVGVKPPMTKSADPVLVTVTDCCAELPTRTEPKSRLVELRATCGASTSNDRTTVAVAAGLCESVTVIVTVEVPAEDGVPEIVPELGSMLSPAGSPVADQV
jgi:hypothetical protein